MGFSRREPLHERLAREGGLSSRPAPHEPGPHWGEVGIHGMHRLREWDALVTLRAELSGDLVRFVVLPDRTLLVEEGAADADPNALADALEGSIQPAYRAEAVRRQGDLWAVGAVRIDVVRLADDPGVDLVQLAWDGTELTLTRDGKPSLARLPELEALAASRFATYVVEAARLDGDLWEALVTPL